MTTDSSRTNSAAAAFEWGLAFCTGHAGVDNQHRGLLELINRLSNLRIFGADDDAIYYALDKLRSYAADHFAYEERLMRDAGLTGEHPEAHIRSHREFLRQATELVEAAGGDVSEAVDRLLGFLLKWLAFHILDLDMEMAREIEASKRPAAKAADVEGEHLRQGRSVEVLIAAMSHLFDQLVRMNHDLVSAHRKLKASSEMRFRAIADYTYHWEIWLSPEGALLWTNPAAARVTGYELEECRAMADFPLPMLNPAERSRFRRMVSEGVAGQVWDDEEFQMCRKDGSQWWAACCCQPMVGPDGRPHGVRISVRDISEHKLAEAREHLRGEVLERLALGGELRDALEAIARAVEGELSGARVSVLLLDSGGEHLRHGAAPSLPDF